MFFRTKQETSKYGWKRQIPDHRDYKFIPTVNTIPISVDLRPNCAPVVDQGQLGSCTANSIAVAHQFDQMKQGSLHSFLPSRLFIYYNERSLEGTIKTDSGAEIRDGIKTIAKYGVPPEILWPYIITKFKTKPNKNCFTQALKHVSLAYYSVNQDEVSIKQALASGYPVVFGFSVYESFESNSVATTGIVPMPSKSEKLLGGHAVLMVGYDDSKRVFIVQNSWGLGWGDKGFFYIPYDYVTNKDLASDFWVIQTVKN